MGVIHLIPISNHVAADDVVAVTPHGQIVACDFYISGIEQGEEVVGGYQRGRILNVDHHSPTQRMQCRVSSTNLALARAEADLLPPTGEPTVVINHIDCDSILSGGIMAGRLPPDARFGRAAIAADHTGEENPIADLLQGLDAEQARQNHRELDLSFRNLERLLKGEPLEDFARSALDNRLRKRSAARELIARAVFRSVGPVSFAVVDEPIDGEFFPSLLPGAVIIMLANPLPSDRSRWQMKVRLGVTAPPGFALSDLALDEFDPAYGGRWNAGSNRRGGGTTVSPEQYAQNLASRTRSRLRTLSGV